MTVVMPLDAVVAGQVGEAAVAVEESGDGSFNDCGGHSQVPSASVCVRFVGQTPDFGTVDLEPDEDVFAVQRGGTL